MPQEKKIIQIEFTWLLSKVNIWELHGLSQLTINLFNVHITQNLCHEFFKYDEVYSAFPQFHGIAEVYNVPLSLLGKTQYPVYTHQDSGPSSISS